MQTISVYTSFSECFVKIQSCDYHLCVKYSFKVQHQWENNNNYFE